MLIRSNTAAWWAGANPVLALDDVGEEYDTGRKKTGDGVSDWNTLPYSYITPGDPALDALPVGFVFISVVATNPNTLLGYGTWAAFGAGRVLVGLDAGDPAFDTVEETGGAKTHTLLTTEIPAHTHVQDAHTHTQNSHNHTQDAHTHTQNAHSHTVTSVGSAATGGTTNLTGASDTSSTTATAANATAVNQNATATNQAATATNQNATATNQSTGGGGAHNNLQPYIVVYMFKRIA